MKKINLGMLAIVILGITGCILAFLIYDINKTERFLARSLIQKPMQSVEVNLQRFFSSARSAIFSCRDHAEFGKFDTLSPHVMNSYFSPLIRHYPQLSSVGLAKKGGMEYDVLPEGNKLNHRIIRIDKWGMQEKWQQWQRKDSEWIKIKEWKTDALEDPRERPWYKGAQSLRHKDSLYWTQPYIYNTTFQPGITASLPYNHKGEKGIIAFDLTLTDITNYTRKLKVSPGGKTFVLSQEEKYLALPDDEQLKTGQQIKAAILKHPDSVDIPSIAHALHTWKKEIEKAEIAFKYKGHSEKWWGKLMQFPLSRNNYLILGVVIPEKDILTEVQRSKRIMIGGFIFILILTASLFYSFALSTKANRALVRKNEKITLQNFIIEERNKEILDSISYAKRLQKAILPREKQFKKHLPESFVFYSPKDIVAGDFYWMEVTEERVFFAAADCTGHGVPGAMVSVVCSHALSKAVTEENITTPAEILDRTRELVINRFAKNGKEDIKDGMDIALCSFDANNPNKSRTLQYAGAYNPLWIIHKDGKEVKEITADKQPIGKQVNPSVFTNHEVILNKGDSIYIFSDGFADQFGGEKGKKYKSERFKKFLCSINHLGMADQKKAIAEEFEQWKGEHDQLDDVIVIGYRI